MFVISKLAHSRSEEGTKPTRKWRANFIVSYGGQDSLYLIEVPTEFSCESS